jgi:ATP dependent DNA ligase-like protein
MECLAVSKLPDGPNWVYEIKLDGYRAEAIRSSDDVAFFSRNGKSLAKKFPYIVEALRDLPPDTIVDGELVALDDSGRPEFNLLQNYAGAAQSIRYFVFDVILLKGRDLRGFPLSERRKLLALLPFANTRIVISEVFTVSAETMVDAVKQQGLEGVVAKQLDSLYESGKADRCMGEDARQSRSGIRDRRLHTGSEWNRRHHRWLLPRRRPDLRCEDAQRLRASVASQHLSEATRTEDREMPVHEPARDAEGPMG